MLCDIIKILYRDQQCRCKFFLKSVDLLGVESEYLCEGGRMPLIGTSFRQQKGG